MEGDLAVIPVYIVIHMALTIWHALYAWTCEGFSKQPDEQGPDNFRGLQAFQSEPLATLEQSQ